MKRKSKRLTKREFKETTRAKRGGKRPGKLGNLRASAGERRGSVFSDCESTEDWRKLMRELDEWRRIPKERVTLNLDADVLEWFRSLGRGYQWEINRALALWVRREEKKGQK